MALKKIELTEDLLKLISNIHFQDVPTPPEDDDTRETITYGIDYNSLFGGNFLCEDVSMILGRYDERIEGTEENPLGVQFPIETENYFWELYTTIIENIEPIEELVHQFSNKGGLVPGVYVSKGYDHIWRKQQ